MGFWTSSLILLAFLPPILAQNLEEARLSIDTSTIITETDASYICATIDWWPQDKCNYNRCPWGSSSVINLNLSHPFLNNAVQAFKNLRIRIGGSLQDQVLYNVGKLNSPCHQFRKERGGLFGFSKGCLHMERWDELNNFFKKTGAIVTFGLNALYGRRHIRRGVWGGDWNSGNARDFINYTISKEYHIDSWEFGNELCGKGVGASVGPEQYGKDSIHLNAMVNELYKNFGSRPLILAPGGFFDKLWFKKLLQISGSHVVDVISHHLYNLGPANDPNLASKILNPDHLNKASFVFSNITSTVQVYGPWTSAWIGESGGAYNNGARDISNTFLNSFWYLDQLGMAAKYNTKVYCRQTLIGGFYGLLNKTTFIPNPDYYSALLWHRLMGKGVLAVNSYASPHLRAYAHCSKERAGITVLLINLSNQTVYNIEIESSNSSELPGKVQTGSTKRTFVHGLKESVSWIGRKAADVKLVREEYHLTPENGDLRSKTMMLNDQPLQLTEKSDIPSLVPIFRDLISPLTIAPLSIKFVVFPNFNAPSC
ncbi:heparanase-like protein 2 [Primulina eburnea]|uniref:heparanase-like protein 2 n=1 Tax=Primulina eburnea TaxID=1245227 RepID=UPI003C6BFAAC